MNLFVDYIQPLVNWLHTHPHWALFITFVMSLAESVAIIGVIVPGSVTMTAIGILAGSGVMRIDLTLLAAIAGAVAGDSLSYAIGYFYSEKLVDVWPFSRYPHWLTYGREFFSRHGGKSVLLGRFIGPLRASTPIIAGMMRMKQGPFLLANVISAIGWSLLYVLPGILIGAASAELSTESATRLFLLILVVLAGVWIISLFFKFSFKLINNWLKRNVHPLWMHLKKNPVLFQFFQLITPEKEKNHHQTAVLLALTLFSFIAFILLTGLHIQLQWISNFNSAAYMLVKSLHSSSLQSFFIVCTQLTSIITMTSLGVICCLWFVSKRKFNMIVYLISVIFFSTLVAWITTQLINSPSPKGILASINGSSFPAITITVATAFYSFIYFYITLHYDFLSNVLRTLIFTTLGLSGLGFVFSGHYWVTDVIAAWCCGLFISLVHCLVYRKLNTIPGRKNSIPILLCVLAGSLVISTGLSTWFNFKTLTHNYTLRYQKYVLNENQWWNQQKPVLPLFLLNRLGKRNSLLNIQYSGDLESFENTLEQHGWELHNESFFVKFMQMINTQSDAVKLPLWELLYNNKRPELMMTFNTTQTKLILELRMWESDYYLTGFNTPLWIGTIRVNNNQTGKMFNTPQKPLDVLSLLMPSLNQFSMKKIRITQERMQTTALSILPYILLIKNKE